MYSGETQVNAEHTVRLRTDKDLSLCSVMSKSETTKTKYDNVFANEFGNAGVNNGLMQPAKAQTAVL